MLTGFQLRLLRQSRGLVQKELAVRMSIAQQRLSALEKQKNKISKEMSGKGFNALKCSENEAFQFLKNLSNLNGGGETLTAVFFLFIPTKNHVKKMADTILSVAATFSLCTANISRLY